MSLRNQPHFVGGNIPWKLWVRLRDYVDQRRTTFIKVLREAIAFYLDAQGRDIPAAEWLPKSEVTVKHFDVLCAVHHSAIAELIQNGFDAQRQGTE